jgi:hypothetical protein
MSSSAATPATARLADWSIGIGFIALIGSVGSPMASDRHGDEGTSRLSRAELIERVVRYHPHPDPELRARTSLALSDYGPDQFAIRVSAECMDSTSSSPLSVFD